MPSRLDAVQQQLQLTPQETALYQRHLQNLGGAGKVLHPDGSISTLYQMSVQGPGNQTYNIPSVYGGKIVSGEEAIARAAQQGWQTFPAYPTPDAAEARYAQMHEPMNQDVGSYLKQQALADALVRR